MTEGLLTNVWANSYIVDGCGCGCMGGDGCGCGGGLVLLSWPGLTLHDLLEWISQKRGIADGRRERERSATSRSRGHQPTSVLSTINIIIIKCMIFIFHHRGLNFFCQLTMNTDNLIHSHFIIGM